MSRFLIAILVVSVLVLVPSLVLAQDLSMPGRGEILELRRDDSRNQEGYRSFIFGPWAPHMGGFGTILSRVNADLEGQRPITMEQLDAANRCLVIYHRPDRRSGRNGSCDTNSTSANVSFADYCEGAESCSRWPMVNRVYRIPARPRLTPGERAEQMVATLDGTTVTHTVPAPAQLGGWMTELSALMEEQQPPSYVQVHDVLAAFGRTLERAPAGANGSSAVMAPVPTVMPTVVPAVLPPASRPTSVENGFAHQSSTLDEAAAFTLAHAKLVWSVFAILSIALIILILKDKFVAWYRPTSMTTESESPEAEIAPPPPTKEQERDKKFFESLERLWKHYAQKAPLSEESLVQFFLAANANATLALAYGNDLLKHADEIEALKNVPPKIEYREDTKRIEELETANREAYAQVLQTRSSLESTQEALTKEREQWHSERVSFAYEMEKLTNELSRFKEKAKSLVETLFQEGFVNLDCAMEHAAHTGDTSAPSMMKAVERIALAHGLFQQMVQGVFNDLLIYLDSDLATLVRRSVRPLPIESTQTGVGSPKSAEPDDIPFRISQHAPVTAPTTSKRGKKQAERDERRRRRMTEPIERVQNPLEELPNVGTLVMKPPPFFPPTEDLGTEPDSVPPVPGASSMYEDSKLPEDTGITSVIHKLVINETKD